MLGHFTSDDELEFEDGARASIDRDGSLAVRDAKGRREGAPSQCAIEGSLQNRRRTGLLLLLAHRVGSYGLVQLAVLLALTGDAGGVRGR